MRLPAVAAHLVQLLLLLRGLLQLQLLAPAHAQDDVPERAWMPVFLHEYKLAICNDGSTAAYYYRPALPGSRRWLVYLDGAGWCWDTASCAHDWQRVHGTSSSFPRTVQGLVQRSTRYLQSGVFDPIRSPLADAHIAFVKSCSNDAFMGDKSPTIPLTMPFAERQPDSGWYFRGRKIVESVFVDLQKRTGLGALDGDRVVYGGCSAGARGAMVTLDHFATDPAFVGKAAVTGLLDSGFWVPISPRTSFTDWDSFGHQMRASLELMNSSSLIGEECGKKYPGAEGWKCLMAAYRLPFVRTPYFLVHSQYDLFALSMNLWGHYWIAHKFSRFDLEWAEDYRKMIVEYLPEPANGSRTVIFSPACYFHCIVTVPRFWTTTADGLGLADTLRSWLAAPEGSSKIYEKCRGFNCGFRRDAHIRVRSLLALPEDASPELAEMVASGGSSGRNLSERPLLSYHSAEHPPLLLA